MCRATYLSHVGQLEPFGLFTQTPTGFLPTEDKGAFMIDVQLPEAASLERTISVVKEGVKRHGAGKWMEIKKEFGQVLRNRTSVQIKDCWRTMSKNNEV